MVSVAVPEAAVMLPGLIVAVRPVELATDKLIVSLKRKRGLAVMVEVPAAPTSSLSIGGEAEREKSG